MNSEFGAEGQHVRGCLVALVGRCQLLLLLATHDCIVVRHMPCNLCGRLPAAGMGQMFHRQIQGGSSWWWMLKQRFTAVALAGNIVGLSAKWSAKCCPFCWNSFYFSAPVIKRGPMQQYVLLAFYACC